MTGRKSQIKCALCGKTIISKKKEEPKVNLSLLPPNPDQRSIIFGNTQTFGTRNKEYF
jgi:hypothetical protein